MAWCAADFWREEGFAAVIPGAIAAKISRRRPRLTRGWAGHSVAPRGAHGVRALPMTTPRQDIVMDRKSIIVLAVAILVLFALSPVVDHFFPGKMVPVSSLRPTN